MAENKETDIIDIGKLIKKVWSKRKLFLYKVWPITFVLSCIYILGVPRHYSTDTKLAPEAGNATAGTLGSLASSFGFDLGGVQPGDAITPMLYPDLMDDNGFVTGLFGIKVESKDGEIRTTYYDYLRKHQKRSIWSYPMSWLKSLLPKEKSSGGGSGGFDPYDLSKSEDDICNAIRGNIKFGIDNKTGVITITTKAQDPKICKVLADSVSKHLQDFITMYRTNKARIDYDYYLDLTEKSRAEYDAVRQKYAAVADANTNISLRSMEIELENLENDMRQKQTNYTTISTQLEAAKAKVQERTPAFTVLKGATVPLMPSGPKRMVFVIGMLIMVTIATIIVVIRKDIKEALLQTVKK